MVEAKLTMTRQKRVGKNKQQYANSRPKRFKRINLIKRFLFNTTAELLEDSIVINHIMAG